MDVREEIESLTAEFARAVTGKDLDAMSSFYEEDARFLAPGAPMATGRQAIRDVQRQTIERGLQTLELEAVEVIEAGDLFVEIGRMTITIQPPGAPAMRQHGKSVVVWRRQQDGTLKIAVDAFNSDSIPRG